MTEGLIVALLLVGAAEEPRPAAAALASLRERVLVDLVDVKATALPGFYQRPPKGVGGLAGEEIHLFPDGTYVYCEWADVWPLTVHDKGEWRASEGILKLVSDADITWDPGIARRHILVRRQTEPSEVLVIALDRDPMTFFDLVQDIDPDRVVVFLSLSRSELYTDQPSTTLTKSRLLRDAWRPEAFRE